ncbi:MAG: hypothetical protein K5662_00150 [Lachnospiraceae bacterium]|nr:hypothetical protein [Lachnospiraceae bacterium]
MICRFIPRHVGNGMVLTILEVLRVLGKLKRKDHAVCNSNITQPSEDELGRRMVNGYIEDQRLFRDVSYGVTDVGFAGCEVIALFNALRDLGYGRYSFVSLLRQFEHNGILHGGLWGTSPLALGNWLKAEGLQVYMAKKRKRFEEITAISDAMILTFYNDGNDLGKQIHTVSITCSGGGLIPHNAKTVGGDKIVYHDIAELCQNLADGNIKPLLLIGIRRRQ